MLSLLNTLASPRPTSDKIGDMGEMLVCDDLRKRGAVSVYRSPGSRTPTDIRATFADGSVALVQVKASLGGEPAGLSREELVGIRSRGSSTGATAYVAKVRYTKIDATGSWWHLPVEYIQL